MTNAIIIACIIFSILFLLIYIRGKRPWLYFSVIFLSLCIIMIADRFINDTGKPVVFSPDPRHTALINGSSMYSALRSKLKNTIPVFIGDNPSIRYTETAVPGLDGKLDTGIDTVIIEGDTAHVFIRVFTGNEIPCSIAVLYSGHADTIPAFYGSNSIPAKGIKNITLICNDENPYNEYWAVSDRPHYLVCTSASPRRSQRMASELGNLYHEAAFSSGYITNGEILSLDRNYDGYIIVGSEDVPLPDSSRVLYLKAFSIPEAGSFLQNAPVHMRIKKPFSPDQEFNVNAVSVKTGILRKALMTALTVLLSAFLVLVV